MEYEGDKTMFGEYLCKFYFVHLFLFMFMISGFLTTFISCFTMLFSRFF